MNLFRKNQNRINCHVILSPSLRSRVNCAKNLIDLHAGETLRFAQGDTFSWLDGMPTQAWAWHRMLRVTHLVGWYAYVKFKYV